MKTGETKVIDQREQGSMSGGCWQEFLILEKLSDTDFLLDIRSWDCLGEISDFDFKDDSAIRVFCINWSEITEFIEDPVLREAANSFGGGTKRGAFMNGTPGLQWQNVFGRIPHGQGLKETVDDTSVRRDVTLARRAMDQMGLDYQVVFPNGLLFLGMHPVKEMEIHLAGAYNRWIVECLLPQEPRVKAMLYLPINDPEAAEITLAQSSVTIGVTPCMDQGLFGPLVLAMRRVLVALG